jgi:hypothetical protein
MIKSGVEILDTVLVGRAGGGARHRLGPLAQAVQGERVAQVSNSPCHAKEKDEGGSGWAVGEAEEINVEGPTPPNEREEEEDV